MALPLFSSFPKLRYDVSAPQKPVTRTWNLYPGIHTQEPPSFAQIAFVGPGTHSLLQMAFRDLPLEGSEDIHERFDIAFNILKGKLKRVYQSFGIAFDGAACEHLLCEARKVLDDIDEVNTLPRYEPS